MLFAYRVGGALLFNAAPEELLANAVKPYSFYLICHPPLDERGSINNMVECGSMLIHVDVGGFEIRILCRQKTLLPWQMAHVVAFGY